MVTLKKLASTGCTLLFSLNQSSTEVFGLFDRICLLSNGNTLFFGETLACLQVIYLYISFTCPCLIRNIVISHPINLWILFLYLINLLHSLFNIPPTIEFVNPFLMNLIRTMITCYEFRFVFSILPCNCNCNILLFSF